MAVTSTGDLATDTDASHIPIENLEAVSEISASEG